MMGISSNGGMPPSRYEVDDLDLDDEPLAKISRFSFHHRQSLSGERGRQAPKFPRLNKHSGLYGFGGARKRNSFQVQSVSELD